MEKYVKTVVPVPVNPRNGQSETLYFATTRFMVDEKAEFKNQIGVFSYQVDIFIMDGSNLVPADTKHPHTTPVIASYKLSTWRTLFGNMSLNQILEQKAELMMAQIAYNAAEYYGLTAENLTVVEL